MGRTIVIVVSMVMIMIMDTNMDTGMDTNSIVFIDIPRSKCLYCLSMSIEGPSQVEEKKETIATCLD